MPPFARAHVPRTDNAVPETGWGLASCRVALPGDATGLQARPEPPAGVPGGRPRHRRGRSHWRRCGAWLRLPSFAPASGKDRRCRRVSGAAGSGAAAAALARALPGRGVARPRRGCPAVASQGFAAGVPDDSFLSYRERGSSVSEPASSRFAQRSKLKDKGLLFSNIGQGWIPTTCVPSGEP